jgi:hypothetical protein
MTHKRSPLRPIHLTILFSGLFLTSFWILADEFDDVERAKDIYVNRFEELRRMTPSELKAVVAAICDAEEDERRSVSRDAAERVASRLRNATEEMSRRKEDFERPLPHCKRIRN